MGEEIGGIEVEEDLHQAASYAPFLLVGLHIVIRKMLFGEIPALLGWIGGEE